MSDEFPKVEEALYTWFHQQREWCTLISGNILKAKAKFLQKEITKNKISMTAMGGSIIYEKWSYMFSSNKWWNGVSRLLINWGFIAKLEKRIEQMGLSPDQLYNPDKKGLNWWQLPTKTS